MRVAARLLIAGTLIGASGTPLAAQAPPDPFATLPPVPPPTALEAFSPSDTLVTMGYTELGGVAAGSAIVRVDVRELRTASGDGVRGVTVDVIESQTRRDRSFLDVDEIAPLLRGIDAMLEVRSNPTSFDRYELRYVTRGELWLRTVVTPRGAIVYAMQVGRTERAQAQLEVTDLVKLRGLFAAAAAKLGTP